MSIVLDYVATTNPLTISDNGTITNVAGTGINNNFTVPQSFAAGVAVSGSTILQAVSGTTGNFTGAIGASGFTNSGSTTLQAVSGTTGNFTGAVTALANASTTSGSLAGTTAGTVDYSMPDQGVAKKFVAFFNAYENDTTTNQTINFPMAFGVIPLVLGNNTGLTLTPSTTGVTITAPDSTTAYSVTAVIMGN